jgi:hypothetical protein
VILAQSPPKSPWLDPVPVHQGLRPAIERHLLTRIPLRRPRRWLGNLWAGSRSLALNKKLLFQLLHRELGKGSRSSDPKGIFIINSFFCHLLLIHRLQCRVPQDIPSTSPARDSQPESESPRVDKPPSPSARKIILKTPNPSGPEDTHVPTGAASIPTSLTAAISRHDAAHPSPRPDPSMHQDASAISPKSFGLGAHGGPQPGEGSSVPRPGKQ